MNAVLFAFLCLIVSLVIALTVLPRLTERLQPWFERRILGIKD